MFALLGDNETFTLLDDERAEDTAAELNRTDEDGWTYVPVSNGSGKSFINVYDSGNELLGKL